MNEYWEFAFHLHEEFMKGISEDKGKRSCRLVWATTDARGDIG